MEKIWVAYLYLRQKAEILNDLKKNVWAIWSAWDGEPKTERTTTFMLQIASIEAARRLQLLDEWAAAALNTIDEFYG